MMDDILIFVDGELYTGRAVHDALKGVGWPGGRTAGLFLEKSKAARYQKVHIVVLKYGKLRACTFNPKEADLRGQLQASQTYWDVEVMPGDR